jgi:hypothetical protein
LGGDSIKDVTQVPEQVDVDRGVSHFLVGSRKEPVFEAPQLVPGLVQEAERGSG